MSRKSGVPDALVRLDAQPQSETAPSINVSTAGRDDAQELMLDDWRRSTNEGIWRQQSVPNTSHARTSVLPSSPALSAYSDEWQWEDIFPETILCTLTLFRAGKRKTDQAHESIRISSDGPKPIQWYKHDTYEELKMRQDECVKRAFSNLGTQDLYIRHGLCRIIGKKHEAWREMDDFFKLEQTAITLICGFISGHDHEIFSMEVSWEYATMQIKPRPHESFAKTIQKELARKILQNYAGKEYIPRADLIKIMNKEVIERIINEDEDVRREGWSDEIRQQFFRVVQRRASRLQAVCIKQYLSMGFLRHLLASELDDLHGPTDDWLKQHRCDYEDCELNVTQFLSAYYSFFPHKFDMDYVFREFSQSEVIPLYYSESGVRNIGYGAASIVCEIKIDPVQHSLSTDRRCAFALKKFHEREATAAAFKREQAMIEKLAKKPHEHITPYFAMWTQSGISYILFPRAKYNLREFMASTADRPQLTAPLVLWFLGQLKGLAGAVNHFHWIGEESSPDVTAVTETGNYRLLGADLKDKTQNRLGLAGFHHDIKSDNILVFEKETTQPGNGGTFKITDFGAGRFADLRLGDQSSGVAAAKGTLTYKAPDRHPSRPYDLWGLGCVFIELLIWALTPEQDGGRGFSSRRGWIADHAPGKNEPTHPDDAFWYRDPLSDEIKLRPAVQMQLEDLFRKYSRGMDAFRKVTRLTQDLFTIDPFRRPTAAQAFARLTDILEKARDELEKNPSCYLQDHNRRSGSLSASNVPSMEATPVEKERGTTSSKIIRDSGQLGHVYDSDGSPKPFLRRMTQDKPPGVPSASEYTLYLSSPGVVATIAPEAGEENIELESGTASLRSDTKNALPWRP